MSYALITGAGNGIGFEIANALASRQTNLVIIDIDSEKLLQVSALIKTNYKISVVTIQKDLSNIDSAKEIYSELLEKNISIDILVNNAGFAVFGSFRDTDISDEQKEINLHIITLTILTKLFLKNMTDHNYGRILNVASMSGFIPSPYLSVYSATKAYIINFTQSINAEFSNANISATVLCPGATNTAFTQNHDLNKTILFKINTMSPEKVAEIAINGMLKKKSIVIPGFINKIGYLFTKLLSKNLQGNIVNLLLNVKNSKV